MVLMVMRKLPEKDIMDHQPPSQSTSNKVERRIIEKNRRNQMKSLYSRLNSLLPDHNSKEPASVPDQIDAAINYITDLETKLKKSKEMKQRLAGRKRPYTLTNFEETASVKSPKIEIWEVGSTTEVVLVTGLDNHFIFYEIIHILHEEQVDVQTASYSIAGDSILHVVHAEIVGSSFDFGAAKVTQRLKRLVYGSTSDVELEPDLWEDFNINSEPWDF